MHLEVRKQMKINLCDIYCSYIQLYNLSIFYSLYANKSTMVYFYNIYNALRLRRIFNNKKNKKYIKRSIQKFK